MAQVVSDLVITLDVDGATFREQMARARKLIQDNAAEEEKVARRKQNLQEQLAAQLKSGADAAVGLAEKQVSATQAVGKSYEAVARSVAETHQQVNQIIQAERESAAQAAALKARQDALTESFFRQIAAAKSLSDGTGALSAVQARVREARKNEAVTQHDYLALLSASAGRTREITAAENEASTARVRFLQQLKAQVVQQKLSTTEMLRHKAAQLGAGSAAEQYIRKLESTTSATGRLRRESSAARRELGVLLGELARGNVGALRGSGITLANRAGWIDQLMTLRGLAIGGVIGGIAASVYALGKAWYEGSQESVEFNKQLLLTGNYAGKTVLQLQAMAKSITGNGITQHDASSILAKVVGSGAFSGNQLETVTRAAAAMEEATGQSVDKTIANFQKLYDSPAKASAELNSQLHYLTAAQFEYISSLERRGDKEAAGQAAADAYSRAEQQRSQQLLDNLGLVERAALATRNAFKGMWDELLNIGRAGSDGARLQTMKDTLAEIQENSRQGLWGRFKNNAMGVDKAQLEENIKNLEFVIKSQEGYNEKKARFNRINKDGIDAQISLNKYLDAGTTQAEKRTQAQKDLNKAIADNARAAKATQSLKEGERVKLWTPDEIAKARAGIEKLYKDPKTPKAKAYHDDGGEKMLEASRERLAALKQQSVTTGQMTAQESQLAKFNQQIADLKQKRILTADQQSILARADEIRASLQLEATESRRLENQKQLAAYQKTAAAYGVQQAQASVLARENATVSDRQGQLNARLAQLKIGYDNNPASKLTGKDRDAAGQAYQSEVAAAKKSFDEQTALRSDWQAGAEKAWADYADSATDVYSQMKSAGATTFNGLTSQLTTFLTTGKSNFKGFTTSILSMLSEILVKMSLVNGLKSAAGAMGWSSLLANANGGVYTSPSLSAYSGTVVDHPTFFAFAKGGGVMGEAGPEAILPLRRGSNGKLGVVAGSAGGSGVTVNMGGVYVGSNNPQQGSGSSSADAGAIARQLKPAIISVVSEQARMPGTPLWTAINGKR